ncbi:MAG: DUF4153 domain-containing protein [Candidatus Zixiibacteriota bacterium]
MSVFRRFPSYDQIIHGAAASAARFPLSLISALIGVAAAVTLADRDYDGQYPVLEKLLACAALGIPLFVALTTFAEKRLWARSGQLFLQSAGVVLLTAYYFSLPAKINEPMYPMVRFALLFIGLHFLVAWLPWTGRDQVVGFWQYNKTLFLRLLISGLYSVVLFLGLALALAAIDHLFEADIQPETYFRLWITIVGLFFTWVVLAGVPKDLAALNQSDEYPSGLKVFTQFILLPLVGIYFVILIAYEAKIIIEWNWPRGWVSELVLWYAVIGILSSLLLHPLRERIESRWIEAISKWYYLSLVPLVVMLFLAIMRRISDYGVTENRYFVLAMAVGLAVGVGYMIVSKRKDMRLIPIIICLIAFLSAYGPWSAFAVSRGSQQARLAALMARNGMLVEGTAQKPPAEPTLEDRQQMSSATSYLNEMHGLDAFAEWLPDSTRQGLDTLPFYTRDEATTEKLGFAYASPAVAFDRGKFAPLRLGDEEPISTEGYDLMLRFDDLSASKSIRNFTLESDTCRLEFDTASCRLTLQFRGVSYDTSAVTVVSMRERLPELMEKRKSDDPSPQDMTFHSVDVDSSAMVVLKSIWFGGDSLNIRSLNGYLFLRRPK